MPLRQELFALSGMMLKTWIMSQTEMVSGRPVARRMEISDPYCQLVAWRREIWLRRGGTGSDSTGARRLLSNGEGATSECSMIGSIPSEEALCGAPITTRLDEDVDHIAVLVDGTPEILTLALDGDIPTSLPKGRRPARAGSRQRISARA